MTTPGTTRENRHEPALDGIRGLAILLVLLSHGVDFLGLVPHGHDAPLWATVVSRIFMPCWGGVDLFFALSGFLITGILLRSRERATYFSSFYARRALRIFPIYYLVLIVSLLVSLVSVEMRTSLPHDSVQRLSYFLYVANWPVFWSSWKGMTGLWGAYWSLNVEEQFYLVWPMLIRRLKPPVILALCVTGFFMGWIERGLLVSHFGLAFGIMQWPFSRLDGLFLGAALAIYRFQRGKPVPKSWAILSFATGAALYGWVAIAHVQELDYMGLHLWQTGVSAFALMSAGVIAGVEYKGTLLSRAFSWTPLRILGRYSYGIYIYHLFFYQRLGWFYSEKAKGFIGQSPTVALVYIAFTILVTVGFSALSFHFFEAPLLRLKRFFPSPAPAV